MRYIIPKDIHTLFVFPEGKSDKITDFHDFRSNNSTFCNIVERKNVNGIVRYKVRVSTPNGEIREGWTPGCGLDPVVYDPNNDLLDGRFNL